MFNGYLMHLYYRSNDSDILFTLLYEIGKNITEGSIAVWTGV